MDIADKADLEKLLESIQELNAKMQTGAASGSDEMLNALCSIYSILNRNLTKDK